MQQDVPEIQRIGFSVVSPILAVLFTNPFDTVKIRLQLQGQHGGGVVYKNSFDCMWKIFRTEGIQGLQKGLTPAIYREGSKNLFRLGMYEPIVNFIHDKKKYKSKAPIWKRAVAGGISGALGAIACNPFELIKTRMQSNTGKSQYAIGHQYEYKSVIKAFFSIAKNEGFWGLYRGSSMSVARAVLGSGTNLSTYTSMREYLIGNKITPDNSLTDMGCGLISSLFTVLVMNPVDAVRTRIYNQPKGEAGELAYKSGMDCAVKMIKHEGIFSFMKGFWPSFLRLGPHFTLTFVFYEQFKRISINLSQAKQ